jgi:hypothetical protein
MRDADRGQSETLGFVLVFAIIITSVVLVAATGYGGLQQVQAAERTNNAVQSFEILADNVDALAAGAPSRETELTLAGAGLSFGDPVTVRVEGERVTDSSESFSYEYELRPLVYDPDTGSTLVYANGAVIRVDPGGMLMLREPGLRLTKRESVIPVVQVRSPETRSVGGQSTVIVRTKRNETVPLAATTGEYEVTYEITSPRAAAWERHLQGYACDTFDRNGNTVSCTITTDRAYATLVQVDATFE